MEFTNCECSSALISLQMLSIYSIFIRHMNRTMKVNGRFRFLRTHPCVMNTQLSRKMRKFYSLFIIMIICYCLIIIRFIKAINFFVRITNKCCHLGIIADQTVRLVK